MEELISFVVEELDPKSIKPDPQMSNPLSTHPLEDGGAWSPSQQQLFAQKLNITEENVGQHGWFQGCSRTSKPSKENVIDSLYKLGMLIWEN